MARTIHERGQHPGDRMYREHTHLTLKRERERQRAEAEREKAAAQMFFKPQISKGTFLFTQAKTHQHIFVY